MPCGATSAPRHDFQRTFGIDQHVTHMPYRSMPNVFFKKDLFMSLYTLLGALEIGLIFSLVALGVLISFRILTFPDLTVDGSFPLGGAVAATMIAAGYNPFLATGVAILAGALAGFTTAWLNVRLKIMDLLASILMMIALYSINLRVMGKPNVPLINEPTIFSILLPDWMPDYVERPLVLIVVVVLAKLLLDWFFSSEIGLPITRRLMEYSAIIMRILASRSMIFRRTFSQAVVKPASAPARIATPVARNGL